MGQDRETNLALLIDFDNVALGARDAGQRFDIKLLLQRILEKGKVLVKKAYADWHFYKEHMSPLHEAAVELIEIPMPRISGKNSADIKLVVDAMELCYSKDHIDTFVIVSGDSDFSPLVSKLRENNKTVIGVGVKNSSSRLLIGNCDEFIFYDDIFRHHSRQTGRRVKHVPLEKRELFDFLLKTTQGLLQESRGVLYSSLVKDTMTRKQPDFNERSYGYSNFGDLLEDARNMGLLIVERDAQAGGTWVVQGVADGAVVEAAGETGGASGVAGATGATGTSGTGVAGGSRSSRRRRRSSGRARSPGGEAATAKDAPEKKTPSSVVQTAPDSAGPAAKESKQPGRGRQPVLAGADPGSRNAVPGTDPAPAAGKAPVGKAVKKTTRKPTRKVGKKTAGKTADNAEKKVTKKVTKKAEKKAVGAGEKKVAKKVTGKAEGKAVKKTPGRGKASKADK